LDLVNLNDEAVCELCFPSTYQYEKFFYNFSQRSFKTDVPTSRGLYKHI